MPHKGPALTVGGEFDKLASSIAMGCNVVEYIGARVASKDSSWARLSLSASSRICARLMGEVTVKKPGSSDMMPTPTDPLSRLARLAETVDREFEEIQRRQDAQMQCRSGCSACCRAGLSITRVEEAFLRRGLASMHESIREELAGRTRDEKREMCPALDPEGRCQVYAHRPLICRSYGVPLRRRREVVLVNPAVIDVCDLNFAGTRLPTLPPVDVLDQTSLDAAVAEIDDEYCEVHGFPRGERIPIAHILATSAPDTTGSYARTIRERAAATTNLRQSCS